MERSPKELWSLQSQLTVMCKERTMVINFVIEFSEKYTFQNSVIRILNISKIVKIRRSL